MHQPSATPHRHRQDGTITILTLGVMLAILLAGGLVHDGARILAARQTATHQAANAARAAAQAVDLDTLRAGGPLVLDSAAAQQAAHDYLATVAGTTAPAVVTVTGDQVNVVVTRTIDMTILTVVGIHNRTVTGHGHAQLTQGITGPQP